MSPEPAAIPCSPARARRLAWSAASLLEHARLGAEIAVAYVHARRALERAPLPTVVAALRSERRVRMPAAGEDVSREARSLGHAVTRALAVMPEDGRCLMQALVLTRLLARRDISAKLVIGARTAPGFLAHAWVEHAGAPVLFAGDGLFDRLVEL